MKSLNRIVSAILIFLGMVIIGCTEEPAPIAVASVTLDSTSMTLEEGESQKLTATVSPSNAENKTVLWTSSNSSVASVKDGLVSAIKSGKATITAKSDDGGKTATCEVTVKAKVYPVESVSLDKTSYEMTEGDEFTLTATVKPDNATNKNITWSSSNTSVASVSNGKVTALKAGTATITVKTEDGGKTATCKVIVNEKVYPVESVSLDKTSYEMTEGDEFTLTATVKPDNATNKNVTWSSSNTSVAIVSNGTVTAKKAGTTTITVKTEDGGKTATCKVTVNAKIYPVTSVSLDRTSAELTEGDEIVLIATVNPSIASNKNVIWSSSNISVATVSNGTVKALSVGTATITVKTEDRGKTATCTIVVKSATKLVDYIDEYGINHGKGISIINNVYGGYEELPKETVWAPVNCGYHMPDLKYGKLYQRGRKYGQGYGETYGELEPELVKNPGIAAKEISEESNSNKFYYGLNCMLDTPWVDNVWNIGSDKAPIKTENDPCPDGWRVPTEEEIWGLTQNYSSWTINEFGQYGYWFSGINAYSSDVPQIFLPAAGHRGWEYGVAEDRDETGNYWSSSMRNYSQGYHSCFREDRVVIYCDSVAEGYSVRCVQE